MAQLDLGTIGVTQDVRAGSGHLDDATMLEDLGYSTIWIAGGQPATLNPLREGIRATKTIPVGNAIIPAQVCALRGRDRVAPRPSRLAPAC